MPFVYDNKAIRLMPCSEKRARRLMEKGEAIPWYHKGYFGIKLLKEPSDRQYQNVAYGIDIGSMREGYTATTETKVVSNTTTNTPYWVKEHVETRRILRRSRRQRKTPYRKMRANRSSLKKKNRIPPSTRARWGAKLRMIKIQNEMLPITVINVEDVSAQTKGGDKRWNQSFSPLQVGKEWFISEIIKLYPHIKLIITDGTETAKHRIKRGFFKSSNKLEYIWEAHNVDSHSLCEMALGVEIEPFKQLYRVEFLEYYRRQLHKQNPIKGGKRKRYGSTVSMGMSRGSVVRWKDSNFYYLGGSSKGKVAIHNIGDKSRKEQFAKASDIEVMYRSSMTVVFFGKRNRSGNSSSA